jgi:hypothetical protein
LFTGVAFARQGERLELKHSTVAGDRDSGFRLVPAAENDATVINQSTGDVEQLAGRDAYVQELYDKKGPYLVGQLHDSSINQVAEAKETYATEVRDLVAIQQNGGTLTAQQASRLDLSRRQLSEIQEMEDTWVGSGASRPTLIPGEEGQEGGPTAVYSGLSGAAEGVQQAARRMAFRTATINGTPQQVRARYDANGQQVRYAGEPGAPGGAPTPTN